MTESELISEILNSNFSTLAFKFIGTAVFYILTIIFLVCCFNMFSDWIENKHQIKEYLKKHRFERFRAEPFAKGQFVVVEYMGADSPPLVITYCNNFYNADRICDILNCDFLGECYSPRKRKKLSSCSAQFTDKIIKPTENGGKKE